VNAPDAAPAQADRILMYGTEWCSDCRLAKRVMNELEVGYDFVDIDQDPAAVQEVLRLNRGMRTVPTIIFPDGSVLVEPTRRELTERLAGG
jgi:mycoredoxin